VEQSCTPIIRKVVPVILRPVAGEESVAKIVATVSICSSKGQHQGTKVTLSYLRASVRHRFLRRRHLLSISCQSDERVGN